MGPCANAAARRRAGRSASRNGRQTRTPEISAIGNKASVTLNTMPPIVLETLQSLKNYVGREIATTDWFLVTQDRIRQFAEATEDRQWIHVDPERAGRESPYGATIAHGFLTLSLLSYFIKQAIQVPRDVRLSVNYGLNRVRF